MCEEFGYWMMVTMSRPRLCGYRTVKFNHYKRFKNILKSEIYT